MEKDKIIFLKEKEILRAAKDSYSALLKSCAQNPIKAKFLAFQKAKRKIKPDDLI